MRTALAISMVLCFAGVVSADVLWDQPPTGANNFIDQEFPDFPTFSSYMVVDVTVPAGGWVIDKVTTYYTWGTGFWGAGMDARLNIFPKTGSLPGAGDDPYSGSLITGLGGTVTVSVVGGNTQLVGSGISVPLAAGDYWMGMTPVADFGTYGKEYHLDSPRIGDPTAWRNPGNGYGYGTGWQSLPIAGYSFEDAAIKIEGIPEPATLGGLTLGALVLLRRRRGLGYGSGKPGPGFCREFSLSRRRLS